MWTPPARLIKLTPVSAAKLRKLVREGASLARKVRLAMSVDGPLGASALSPAQKLKLRNAAVALYRFIPAYEVPLGPAQAWLNAARWGGSPPQLDDDDRLGWPSFADEDRLLRIISTLAPAAPVKAGARTGPPADLSLADLTPPLAHNVDLAAVAAYRADRTKLWESIRSAYVAYVEAAMKPINECIAKQKEQPGLQCPDKGAALTAAGKHVRGDVRAFVFNLLPHVPTQAAVKFVMAAPKSWGIDSEILLDDKSVTALIGAALPNSQWVHDQDEIDRAKAELDGTFKDWMTKSLTRLDQAASGAGEILKQGAETAFSVLTEVGEGVGKGLQGIGEGVGGFAKYLPLAAGGLLVLAGGAYLVLRKK
jgi:hypothetical protein